MGLFDDSNILVFLFSFIPAIIYSLLIFVKTPPGSVNIKDSFKYIFIGFLSCVFVLGFHLLFPNWSSLLFTERLYLGNAYVMMPTIFTFFFQSFIQIALIEELSKLLAFKIADKKNANPVESMFHFMMIGTGFAIVENVLYAFKYGGEVLINRNYTALIMHMTLGIIFGFFISIGRCKLAENSFFKSEKYKRIFYAFFGLVTVSIMHGIYDLNLFLNSDTQEFYTFIILIISLFVSYKMGKKLINIYNNG